MMQVINTQTRSFIFLLAFVLLISNNSVADEASEASEHVLTLANECRHAINAKQISQQKGAKCYKICNAGRVHIRRLAEKSTDNIQNIVKGCEEQHSEAMSSNANDKIDFVNPRKGASQKTR